MTEASGPAVRNISDIAGAAQEVVVPTRDISFDLPPVFGDAVPPAVQHRCSSVDTIPPLEVFSAPGPFAVTLEGKWPALWSGHEGRPVLIRESTHKKLVSGEVAATPPVIMAGAPRARAAGEAPPSADQATRPWVMPYMAAKRRGLCPIGGAAPSAP